MVRTVSIMSLHVSFGALFTNIVVIFIVHMFFDLAIPSELKRTSKCFTVLLYQFLNNCFQWLDNILLSFDNYIYIIRYLSSFCFSHSINNSMKSMLMHKGFIYFTFCLRIEHYYVLNTKRKNTQVFLLNRPLWSTFSLTPSPVSFLSVINILILVLSPQGRNSPILSSLSGIVFSHAGS